MIIVYGSRKYLKVGKNLGSSVCCNCGFQTEKTLAEEKQKFHIFYIPIFFRTIRRVVACPACGMERELTAAEYRELNK